MLIDFHAVAAQLSFALLGLWWVVVRSHGGTLLVNPSESGETP